MCVHLLLVSGIYNLRNLVSGPVISAHGDRENLAALIVRADGGRRKWWQVWRQVWRCCCEISLCCLQVLLFSSCVASNKNKNIIELQFSIYIFLHWCCRLGVGIGRKRFDQKFFILIFKVFAMSIGKLGSVF